MWGKLRGTSGCVTCGFECESAGAGDGGVGGGGIGDFMFGIFKSSIHNFLGQLCWL